MLEFSIQANTYTLSQSILGSGREITGISFPAGVLWMLDFLSTSTEYEGLFSHMACISSPSHFLNHHLSSL